MAGTPFFLTGFADEIAPDLDAQGQTLRNLGVRGLDLRSIEGINVLDLSEPHFQALEAAMDRYGLFLQSIGSPVNKVGLNPENRVLEMGKLRRAIEVAHRLKVRRIRIFSPEVPGSREADPTAADEVLDWMREMVSLAEREDVLLLHENDAKFWGAYPENAKRLFAELAGDHFRAAYDFANAVLLGYPADHWFPWILPYLDTLHIKDARREPPEVVPAGAGEGQIEITLRMLVEQGWRGPLTLEPHLQQAGAMGGFSGPERFEIAVAALRTVVEKAGGSIA